MELVFLIMEVVKVRDFSLNNIILVSSLPDMGKVGGLVTQHLQKQLDAKPMLKITLSNKPWVNHKDGIISIPKDEYTLSVDEKNNIMIFSGNNQPPESTDVIKLSDKILSEVKKIGNIKLVITAGGYMPVEQSDINSVYGVATNEASLELLKKHKIAKLGNEVGSITWFNGLIMGKALENKIDAVGLFGEISDTDTEQYKAASNVIKKIQEIINLDISTVEIDKKIPNPISKMQNERPGIG